MGEYIPYAGTNAIIEVAVGIQFQHNISEADLSNARMVYESDLQNEFAQIQEIFGTELHMENTDQGGFRIEKTKGHYPAGFKILSVDSEGEINRTLTISKDRLVLHFTRYCGWAATLDDSIRYISILLTNMNLANNGIESFGLRYIDRFTYDSEKDDANTALLFNQPSDFISNKCFDAGPYWHCDSGWFENYNCHSILNQLGIGRAMVDSAPTVTINHEMIFCLSALVNTVGIFMEDAGGKYSGLRNSLDYLHILNRKVMTGLLNQDILNQIGIHDEYV